MQPENTQPNDNVSQLQVPEQAPAEQAPTVMQNDSGPQVVTIAKNKGFFSKHIRPILMVAGLVIFAGVAAAYLGYVVPNKPEHMWNSALVNTGKGYDKLSQFADNLSSIKGSTIDGNFKIGGDTSADGLIKGSSDSNGNGELSGNISAAGMKIDYNFRTIKAANSTYPDVYFKLDGLQGLGDLLGSGNPELTKSINGLNGQWYFIDHSLFSQLRGDSGSANQQISANDIKPVLNAVGNASKQYIFTSDTKKQAIVIRQKIGKETQDGRSVYHYKAGINKANLKAWNQQVCDNLKDTKLFKYFANGEGADQMLKDCKDTSSIDNIKDSDTTDVWVDTHTKLVHKVRFYSSQSNKNNYFDIGQDYQGGDEIPFMLGFVSQNSGKGSIKLVLNTKTNSLKLSGDASSGSGSKTNGNFSLNITPNSAPVKVETPTGAKSFVQLLNDMGLGSLLNSYQPAGQNSLPTSGA